MSENPPQAEAQHGRRRRPAWLIILIILFLLLVSLLCCWFVILPIINPQQPPDETEPPIITTTAPDVTEPVQTEPVIVTEPVTPDVTEPVTPDVTEPVTPDVTEPVTPDVTEPVTPDPANIIIDPIAPIFTDGWNEDCSTYTLTVNIDFLARNQGGSPSDGFSISFAIYNEPTQNPLSNVVTVSFAAIEASTSETQTGTATASINRTSISNDSLYVVINSDVSLAIDGIENDSDNIYLIPHSVPSCGKKGGQ